MSERPPLLSFRTAATASALLVGCGLALALYGACAVLAGLPEAAASAVALAAQGAWQATVVRVGHRGGRGTVAVQALAAVLAFLLGGLLGFYGGASAFFSVATTSLVVLPAGALVVLWWLRTRSARAGADRDPRAALPAGPDVVRPR